MMYKLHFNFVLTLLLLLVPLVQPTTAQESNAENPLAFLKPLVGKKCAIHLKNGEVINGTLWVYGTDYVSVKVKKGLLYSKTERYSASEIDFLKDKAENRYYMPRADRKGNEKPSTGLIVNPEQTIADEEKKLEQEFQGTFRFLSKDKGSNKKESSVPTQTPKIASKKTKTPVVKKTKPVVGNKTEKTKTAKTNLYSARAKTTKKEAVKPAKPSYFTKRTPAKKHITPESALPKEAEQPPTVELKTAAESDSQNAGSTWNQKYSLVAAGILIIASLIFFKIARVKYREKTLFPTRVIEIQGKYAIIDHGKSDGIKADDIIRLYKKFEGHIQYKGKIKIKKVGENYSAVETFKLQPGQELEVSDVGFRDRNLFVAAFKQLRIITSLILRTLAKGLQFTAKNIDVKSSEVDFRSSDGKSNNDESTVVPQDQQVVRVTPGPVTTVKSSNNSKPWEFGMD